MSLTRSAFHRCILLALRFRFSSLGLLGLLFCTAVTVFVASVQGKTDLVRITFFPDDYSLFYAEITGPSGTPLIETSALVKKLAGAVIAEGDEQAESALGFAGYYINEDFSPLFGSNLGYVAVTLPASNKRRFADYPQNDVVAHLEAVREYLEPLVPIGFRLSVRPEKDGPPAGKDLNIRVLGSHSENVSSLAAEVKTYLQKSEALSPWLLDLQDDQGILARVFQVKINAERAAEWGVPVADAAILAASAMEGQMVGEMKLPEENVDIRLKLDREEGAPMASILDIPIRDLPEGVLRLGDLSSAEYSIEAGYLNRFQSQRAVTLTADLKQGAPLTSAMVVKIVEKFYSTIRDRFPGAVLNFSGEYVSTQKSFISLAYAFAIAVVTIYLILSAQFQSYLQPMIIISAVIFALIGVIFGTVFSRTLFTINSCVAIIGVTGVVVNDSLVLVEFVNKCYQQGLPRREALLKATHIRLRPILLTTITTTLGLLPMALGIPEYSVIWGSMAMTFVTGLCTATFLTIIIIPVQWDILTRLNEQLGTRNDSLDSL